MAPQLRRKPKVDDLSSTSTFTPITKPEIDEKTSTLTPITLTTPPSPSPPTTRHNLPLISSIPHPHTHFLTSPSLHSSTPSILTLLSPSNHALWLQRSSPVVSKEIVELEKYEEVDAKWINWVEGGTLVLMSRGAYERLVRSRRRRGKSILS